MDSDTNASAAPGTLEAVVVPVSRNGGPSENASPLVWMIGRLALKARYEAVCKPQVGDTVVEVTHLMGMARHRLGMLSAVGELMKVEQIDGEGEVFTIRTVEGVEQRWLNAEMYVVERSHNTKGQGTGVPHQVHDASQPRAVRRADGTGNVGVLGERCDCGE